MSGVFAGGEKLKKVASSMCGMRNDVSCLLPGLQGPEGEEGGVLLCSHPAFVSGGNQAWMDGWMQG